LVEGEPRREKRKLGSEGKKEKKPDQLRIDKTTPANKQATITKLGEIGKLSKKREYLGAPITSIWVKTSTDAAERSRQS